MTDRQATCEERIDDQLKSELESINQIMFRMDFDKDESDLGYLNHDEIVEVANQVGELPRTKDADGEWHDIKSRGDLVEHILEYTNEERAIEGWSEAPLSVEKRTTIIIQMSWGGPSDQFECVLDDDGGIDEVTYRFMDWFDGATREININNQPNLERFLQRFVDYETGNY